ncbi:PqqD family protein [Hydrogenophaga sp.]|uniref:PqqD family protein n=1 Tax=Hydrogenophaga sp. TaxID=1904254 RepID=UPI0027236211|nr:PqqD family protein [Hydrogenophaga sp.]MDO9606012.1 PqqD family protein [Hydrogenophaga sp.]
MKLSDTVTIPSQVMARTVGDETVILDLASGTYYGLDPVGARIWQLMTEGLGLAQVCDAMRDEYEVSREDIERDVLALVQALLDKQLVVVGT